MACVRMYDSYLCVYVHGRVQRMFKNRAMPCKYVRALCVCASVQVFNFLPTYPRLRDRAYERSVCIHVRLSMCTCVSLSECAHVSVDCKQNIHMRETDGVTFYEAEEHDCHYAT